MTKELELKLVEEFPKILRDYGGDMKHTCMYWGMSFDDGWFNILRDGLQKLQYLCGSFSNDTRSVQIVATQIKEKFGSLRFYYLLEGANQIESSIFSDIIVSIEKEANRTCEITGKYGELCSKGGWLRTLCYDKAKELGYKPRDKYTADMWEKRNTHESLS
jgi:hypothetical protein